MFSSAPPFETSDRKMSADTVVTQEQWQEAERLFREGSDASDSGIAMPQDKYSMIVHLLQHLPALG